MRRSYPPAMLALVSGLVLGAASGDETSPPGEGSAVTELERLHREVQRSVEEGDPFADGRVPDFVLLSTTDVDGETAPCG